MENTKHRKFTEKEKREVGKKDERQNAENEWKSDHVRVQHKGIFGGRGPHSELIHAAEFKS